MSILDLIARWRADERNYADPAADMVIAAKHQCADELDALIRNGNAATPQAPGADTPTTTEQAEAGHAKVLRDMMDEDYPVFEGASSAYSMERAALQAAIDALTRKGGEAAQGWPFVESPGEFTERLRLAMERFPLLGAVRNVLIENPPTLTAQPYQAETLETTNPSEISSKLVGGEADAAYWKQQWEVANRELGKLEKDAERYQWLRDPNGPGFPVTVVKDRSGYEFVNHAIWADELDAAIDAAIAAAPRPVGGDGEMEG